jgi:O-antigen ligase/tetratricopeptide (TPR) repeat protein
MVKPNPNLAAADKPPPGLGGWCVRAVRAAMEAVVLLMACLSPWAFGAVDPFWEFLLLGGLGVVLVLWAAALLLEGRLTWRKCPVALCLAALYLLGVVQATPLPRQVLAAASPAAARWYAEMLPAEVEALPGGEARSFPPTPVGSTLSVYPGATQRESIRLLAVFLLFAAVRNNIATPGAFRRLAVAATATGAALSLFALLQYFGGPRRMVYWTFPAEVDVFGPFICRNHFPFYVNLCLGLGAGLLLSFGADSLPRPTQAAPGGDGWAQSFRAALHDPRRLWVGIALVLMLVAVALSLSRGGLVALACGAVLFMTLRLRSSPRFSRLAAPVLLGGAVLALLAWFGADRVEARLATVLDGQAAHEDRVPLWSRLVPTAAEFPIFGSGYGTFDYVEPPTRTTGEDAGYRYEHAHNDYLEAQLEGGLVRLGLSLLAIGLVYWLGVRAFLRDPGGVDGALALGALFGFTTVVVHSFVDFGLHIPAIAVLATVVCAQLCGAGDRRAASQAGAPAASDRWSFSFLGLAPFAGAAAAVGMAILLVAEGWRASKVEEYREAAARLQKAPDLGRRERGVAYLDAAAALGPEYAVLHLQLGDAHLSLMQDETDALRQTAQAADAARTVLALGPASHPASAAASWAGASAAQDAWLASRTKATTDAHRAPGLRNLLHARDACPLLADAQLRLALRVGNLARAGSREDYLRRAKRLAPDEPDVWYLCGVQELFDGRTDQAHESWRRCLELSDRHLPEIAAGLARSADPAAAFAQVFPDRPAVWLAAADQLYAAPEMADRRRPLLEKAALLWEQSPVPLEAEDLHRLAAVYAALGRAEDALKTYRLALDRRPDQAGWRLEYARLLRELGRLQDSRRELSDALAEQPGNAEVRGLLEAVNHDIAVGQ